MIDALIWAGTICLVFATLLPLSKSEKWWIRVLDFPRLQLFILSVSLILVQILGGPFSSWLNSSSLVFTITASLYHLSWVLPYTPLVPVEVLGHDKNSGGKLISLLCANVLTPNQNSQGLIDLVKKTSPDLLLTLETDQRWEDELSQLESEYPHTIKCPLDNLFGMHLYSRYPLLNAEVNFLVEDGIPSFRCLIEVTKQLVVEAHFLHPTPPVPEFNEESLERDAELIKVARQLENSARPIIVAGDLNDVSWSQTTRLFRKVSGLLDPRVGRGMFNTFHADYCFLRWPLDHVFHSNHFTVSKISRLSKYGSDHFALFAELCYQPVRGDEQSGLSTDSTDEKLATEKIQKVERKS